MRDRRHKRRSSGANSLGDGFESDRSSDVGEAEGLHDEEEVKVKR